MDIETTLHWFYVACMVAGALLIAYWSTDPRGVPMEEYLIAGFIPVWSAAAYLALAFGQGTVEVAGQTAHVARYLDWVVTTPLLLLALALTAMHTVKKDTTLIAGLIGADVFMILTGLIADLSPYPLRYVWYGLGVAAFLVILWTIWNPLRRIAERQGPDLARVYRRVATLLSVLWVAYPLAWIFGPSGIRVFDQTTDTFLFVVVPIFSKVGWSLVDLHSLRTLDRSRLPAGAQAA
jgi:bacteriorhodopsin